MDSTDQNKTGFESIRVSAPDPPDLFLRHTRILQRKYPISKGLLVIREKRGTRFIATATFSEQHTRANLNLRLPSESSLFDKVAEGGVVYSENCCEFFSGNRFERNLLLNWDSASFVIVPLKHGSRVVGILAYSSDQPEAFASFENDLTAQISTRLAQSIAGRTVVSTV